MMTNYSGRCVCIITGASRGFGQAIAQLICNQENGIFGNNDVLKLILMSRNEKELEKTKSLVLKDNPDVNIDACVVPIDMSNTKSSNDVIVKTLEECGKDFHNAFFFCNAGTLGDPGKLLIEYDDIDEIQKIFNLNVVTASFFISRFCEHFQESNRFVIQTSSLCALEPFPSTGLYTSSKACMDMFIRNLVVDCPQVRAINYAPGPLDTQMGKELRDKSGNEGIRENFRKLFDEGAIVNPVESAKKLLMLLRRNEFENGCHIDFYDI